ncbi:EpsG family protein [Moritella marina]|uniref:EpsG family protein n=1 Tax=Moritella marina TaxID=90736 RepID=UPI003703EE32
MIFWYVFLVLIVVVILASYHYKFHRSISWFFLFFVAAFRYNVGTDYIAYHEMYIYKDKMYEHKEIGYRLFVDFFSNVGFSPQFFFFLFSLLTLFLFYKGYSYIFNNERFYFYLATLLFIPFYYFATLNVVRQALAASIFFYSIRFILEKSFFKYLICILIASLFHYSAIVCLILYLTSKVKFSNYRKYLLYIVFVLFIIINPISILVDIYVSFKLPLYYHFNSIEYGVGVSGFGKVMAIILFVFVIFSSNYINKDNHIENVFFNMIICFVFIKIIALDYSIIDRFSNYFKPVLVVFFILFLNNMMKKIKGGALFLPAVTILFAVLYSMLVIYIRGSEIVEYNQYSIDLILYGKSNYIIEVYNSN